MKSQAELAMTNIEKASIMSSIELKNKNHGLENKVAIEDFQRRSDV